MIAIQTRFLSATDNGGAKIVANAICGTKLAKTSIPYPYGLNPEQTIHYLPAKEAIDWTTGVVLSQHQ